MTELEGAGGIVTDECQRTAAKAGGVGRQPFADIVRGGIGGIPVTAGLTGPGPCGDAALRKNVGRQAGHGVGTKLKYGRKMKAVSLGKRLGRKDQIRR